MSEYDTGNPVPSASMPDAWDNMQAIDKFVNSSEETITTRTGEQLDTLHGVNVKADNQLTQQQADFETSQEERDAVVEKTRQNLIPLSRQYMTLAAAQADIANIPVGSTTYYRSPDDSALAIEVMNVSGTLQPTGRTMDAGGNIRQEPLSNNLVEFSDPLGFSHSRIRADGGFETPMSLLGENEISSGNLTITVDPNFSDELVMLSDGLGFTVPVTGSDNGGSVDPGEVTVDLPPQTAAYGLLSKMR
ncbi:TPA: hypothetical protein ACM93X_001969, partial [Escherichia coli]